MERKDHLRGIKSMGDEKMKPEEDNQPMKVQPHKGENLFSNMNASKI